MVERHDYEQVFRAIVSALDRGDVEYVIERCSEDVVVIDYSDPSTVHTGRDAMEVVVRGYLSLFDDLSVQVRSVVADGDRVAAELLLRGTPKGHTEPSEIHAAAFHVYRDGKLVSEHLFLDPAQLPAGA